MKAPSMAASRGPGLSGVITAVIGLAAGALGSAMFSHFRDANAEVKAPLPIVRASAGDEAAAAVREMRTLLALERRRQAHVPADVDVEVESPAAPAAPEPASEEELQLSLEEEAVLHVRAHEAELLEHAREPRDGAWATDAEAILRSRLESLAALSGRVLRVGCKTTTCAAEVEWDHYGAALGAYPAALHADLGINCGKSIVLPKPDDASAVYRATFVLDCEASRLTD